MPANNPLSPAMAAIVAAHSSARLNVQIAIAAGRIVGGATVVHSRSVIRSAPPTAVHSIHSAPPSAYSFSRADSTAVPVPSTSVVSTVRGVPCESDARRWGRAGRVERQLQLHLGDGRPALEVAGGQAPEICVGVDGRALLEVQRIAFATGSAGLDTGVHLVRDLWVGPREQSARDDQPLRSVVFDQRVLAFFGGRRAVFALGHAAPTRSGRICCLPSGTHIVPGGD